MKTYHIYDKNNDNMYCGFVIAENKVKAAEKVIEKHPHFSDNELQLVWRNNRGTFKSKAFGLQEMKETVDEVKKYSNVIE